MRNYIITSIFFVLLISCGTTKQKIDASSEEIKSTKLSRIDSAILVRVISHQIQSSLNVTDFSKIKITYFSDKRDTITGGQIIDRIEERGNNIIAQSNSAQKIIDSTSVKNNSNTNYQEDLKITTITKTKTKKKELSYILIAIPFIIITLWILKKLKIISKIIGFVRQLK